MTDPTAPPVLSPLLSAERVAELLAEVYHAFENGQELTALADHEAAQRATVARLTAERDAAVDTMSRATNAAQTFARASDQTRESMTRQAVNAALATTLAAVDSEREMNAILTEQVERLTQENETLKSDEGYRHCINIADDIIEGQLTARAEAAEQETARLKAIAAELPQSYYKGCPLLAGGRQRDTATAMVDVDWLKGVRALLAALTSPDAETP